MIETNQVESLCPDRIMIKNFNAENPEQIQLYTAVPKQKTKDRLKFYQAPEVLVGQSESQLSLVWTIGLIIDELFMGKVYYHKFADILGPKSIYLFNLDTYRWKNQ